MKQEELNIGDWVYCESIGKKHAKITEIYETLQPPFKRMVSLNANGCRYCVPIEDIQPVQLTVEILEKNGFDSETFLTSEWEREVYFKEFPGCVVEPDGSGKYIFGTTKYWDKRDIDGSPTDWGTMYESRIYNLHYVHDLQRALRCCDLWDLADNFRV